MQLTFRITGRENSLGVAAANNVTSDHPTAKLQPHFGGKWFPWQSSPTESAGAVAVGYSTGKVTLPKFAGEQVAKDDQIYRSESETGHRHRPIGHRLRNFNILTEPPKPVVDLHFKQCSVSVPYGNLAVMGATLAKQGTNPITRR